MEEKEPWRIDKESVHFKVLKGWLSSTFKLWLFRNSQKYNLSEDELLIKIAETIRKIIYRVFQLLNEKTGKEANPPFVVITDNPYGDALTLDFAVETRLGSDFLPDLALARKQLGLLGAMQVALSGIEQEVAASSGGLCICGSAVKFGIAFYDQFVRIMLENFDNIDYRKNFLRVVIEESFHCFCNQTDEFNGKEMSAELDSLRRMKNADLQKKYQMDAEIEKKYGVKQKVDELLQILEQELDDLLSLLPSK